MLLTVILIIISFPSPTHPFITGLKPAFSANSSHHSLSFSSSGLTRGLHDSRDFCCYIGAYPFLLFSFSVLHFLVVVSVRYIKLTHVGCRAHVKIASRFLSYRLSRRKLTPAFYRAMLCIRGTSHGPVSVSVCPSVRLSQIGVLLKRLNVGSHRQHHTIAQGV